MCTVFAIQSEHFSEEQAMEALASTQTRGPDDERILTLPGAVLGFQRLAIMGLSPEGMQPFVLNGNAVVCNGELYGFRTLKKELEDKGYVFQSDSDCEILLPLYEEYGTEMFGMLDAEFACILYDHKTRSLVAARDPMGIRPLFYGWTDKGEIIFASEAKNLMNLTKKVIPFPPGHFY